MEDDSQSGGSERVEVPHTALPADVLTAVIESFVLREGTDYGDRELSLEDKVARLRRLLVRGDAQIIYDPRTDSVDVVTVAGRNSSRDTP